MTSRNIVDDMVLGYIGGLGIHLLRDTSPGIGGNRISS